MTYVVRADGIDFFNLVAEHHCLVNEKLNEVVRGGSSGQQFKFSVDPVDPSAADAGANLRGGEDSVRRKIRAQQHTNCTYNDGAHGIQDFTRSC